MMSVNDNSVVVVGIARTPMGAMQGVFKDYDVTKLGAAAIKGALNDAGVDGKLVSEVFMGCVLPAGVGQAPARQAALEAGLSKTVPCTTVNKVCGSGMKSVLLGMQSLMCGYSDVVVAGGMENMSKAPYLMPQARSGYRLGHGELYDHMFFDGLQDAYSSSLMGCFAEATAERYRFSRERQDEFAINSVHKAREAQSDGRFKREIYPIEFSTRSGSVLIDKDEPVEKAKPKKVSNLKPAFKQNGTVTAANSSSIADGAAVLVLMRKKDALEQSRTILAEIGGVSEYAHEPEWFTTAPVNAIRSVLSKTSKNVLDVGLFEINEAFSVVTLAAMEELNIDPAIVNIKGGACALGHPLGASGARILVTLIAAMEEKTVDTGVASLCIGGGEAIAMLLQR